jgi:hypothetical protein
MTGNAHAHLEVDGSANAVSFAQSTPVTRDEPSSPGHLDAITMIGYGCGPRRMLDLLNWLSPESRSPHFDPGRVAGPRLDRGDAISVTLSAYPSWCP